MFFFIVGLTVDYLFSDIYMCIIDYLLHRIIIIILNLSRIVLEMTLLMAKQLQCWFGICNVIEVWILWNCSGISIVTVYHHNGFIFDAIGYIHIIWIIIDTLHRCFTHKLHINDSDRYKSSENKIIQCTMNKTIAIVVMRMHYGNFTLKMNQFHQSINTMHNFNKLITMVNVIQSITRQMEILIAFYEVIGAISFLISYTAAIDIWIQFNLSLDKTESLSFYLITCSIYDLHLIMLIFNSIDTIVALVDRIYTILVMMVLINVINVISNRKLNYKTTIIWFLSNTNKNMAIIVIHCEKFNANIYMVDKFHLITKKPNNFDTAIIVIMVDVVKLELVLSQMITTIAEMLQFTIIIIVTVRMSMEIIIIVLNLLSLQLFHGIRNGMMYVVNILIKVSILASFSDALSEFEFDYNGYDNTSYTTIVITNTYKIDSVAFVIGFCLAAIYFMKQLKHGSVNIVHDCKHQNLNL